MKERINDYRNKGNYNYNQFNFHRKDNLNNHNINYDLFISSSLLKTNKTLKNYINQKLNSINKNKKYLEKEIFKKQSIPKIYHKKTPDIYYKRERYSNNNKSLKERFLKQKSIKKKIFRTSISKDENKFNFLKNLKNNNINTYFNYNISAKRIKNTKK